MKKIYLSVGGVIITLTMFSFAILYYMYKGGNIYLKWMGMICLFVLVIFGVYFSLVPLMLYDEKGLIRKTLNSKYKGKHLWRNVTSISSTSLTSNTATINFVDDKNQYYDTIIITSLLYRDYYVILKDIVGYVRKENSRAKIDKSIFKQIE